MSRSDLPGHIEAIRRTFVQVLTNPSGFFRHMDPMGGYGEAVIFAIAMGVVAASVQAVLRFVGIGVQGPAATFLVMILISPIFASAGTAVCAALAWLVWRLLGSTRPYQTAFRCLAFTLAIWPITTILDELPIIGSLAALAWAAYLLVCASREVHSISERNAWLAFGGLAIILFLFQGC